MVKAAALYLVIIVSLLIAVISASLLTIAFFYRLEVQKKVRFDRLSANIASGTAILLSDGFNSYEEDILLDLYAEEKDSLLLNRTRWGAIDAFTLKAFELKDTLKRTFFSAGVFDDQSAIYLADEDRPLSVSGNTRITGDGELPKAGLKQAYVDGKPYSGKELIKGAIKDSGRELPALNEEVLKNIIKHLQPAEDKVPGESDQPNKKSETDLSADPEMPFNVRDSAINSFFNKVQILRMPQGQQNIGPVKLKGKIILISDTLISIGSEAILEDVQVYAPAIVVAPGFKGSCQLFARDSIIIGKSCEFLYPSFAGIFKPEEAKIQSKLELGEDTRFSGVLFSYEKKRSDLQTIISLAKNCRVNGEVYATGYIKLERTVNVQGKVTAKRFIMQTPATLYENYLIDFVLNRKLLSKYYLSPYLFKRAGADQKVLKWLK